MFFKEFFPRTSIPKRAFWPETRFLLRFCFKDPQTKRCGDCLKTIFKMLNMDFFNKKIFKDLRKTEFLRIFSLDRQMRIFGPMNVNCLRLFPRKLKTWILTLIINVPRNEDCTDMFSRTLTTKCESIKNIFQVSTALQGTDFLTHF